MNICCETFHAHIMIRLLVNKKNLITASNRNLWPEQYIPPKFSIRQQFINNVILPLTFRDTGGIVICRSLNYRANLKIKEKIFTHWKLQFVSSPQSTNLTALVRVGLPFTKSFQKLKYWNHPRVNEHWRGSPFFPDKMFQMVNSCPISSLKTIFHTSFRFLQPFVNRRDWFVHGSRTKVTSPNFIEHSPKPWTGWCTSLRNGPFHSL